MPLSPLFQPVAFGDLPGWNDDHHAEALAAFRLSAVYATGATYRTGTLGVEHAAFTDAFAAALRLDGPNDQQARHFFETHFQPMRIVPDDAASGFVTGFYEPQVNASPVRTDAFKVPLLAPPADLAKIDDGNRPAGLDPYLAFGRQTPDGIVEYHDRRAIEEGALGDRAEALAWVADPVDAFFIHVQGAARLVMPDGRMRRITYAAKSGQRFTGAGRILVDLGEIPLAAVTMQSIRAWLAAHPHRVDDILRQNRSYIFFREAAVDDAGLGPIAAAKVPLTAGRSMAVDRLLHTFATPFHVVAPSLDAFGSAPFRRLMIAQDTGSAIVGPARGDLFAGSGDAAGEIAGVIRHDADIVALVPVGLVPGAAA
ncbi:murein transglycosylase A [Mesorhizobium sp. CAU 1732]|uniref:murein transglycosylase A n=1 Tax=Mesorhizobium sp. CAU 1732 TaxID=3140358 RepID=UPI0032617D47